jgi:hypothetical protein
MHLWTVRDDLANEGVKYALAAGNIGQIALAENLERVDDQASKDPVALELFSFYGEQTDGVFTDFPGTAVKWRDEFRKRSMLE